MFLYSTDVLVEVIAQCGWVIGQWFIIDSGLDRQSKQDNQKVYQSKTTTTKKKTGKSREKKNKSFTTVAPQIGSDLNIPLLSYCLLFHVPSGLKNC